MKLISVKCPSCGSNLKIKNNVSKMKCEYCGANVILDDEVVKVKHIIDGQISEEQEFRNAETKLNKFKKYNESYEEYLKLSKKYVDRDDVWLGLLRSFTQDFTYKHPSEYFKKQYFEYWRNFIALADEEEINKIKPQYINYVNNVMPFGYNNSINKPNVKNECNNVNNIQQNNKVKTGDVVKIILTVLVIIMGLVYLEYTFLAFFFYVLCGITIIDYFWKTLNFKNKAIRIITPIMFFILALMFSPSTIPETLHGNWYCTQDHCAIYMIYLSENEGTIKTTAGKETSSYSNYINQTITLEFDELKTYELKYNSDTGELCLYKNEKCIEYYKKTGNK